MHLAFFRIGGWTNYMVHHRAKWPQLLCDCWKI